MRKINKLIVHCSATPEHKEFDVEDITEWHVTGNGWSDCGYHYVITLNGDIQDARPERKIGAHCKGHNRNSIGICYIGGMDRTMDNWIDTRTEKQKESFKSGLPSPSISTLKELLKELKQKYPEATVYGHNNFTNKKVCPCFNAKEEYKYITDGNRK